MSDGWGEVRIDSGVLTVGDDAIGIRSTPRLFLGSQFDRLRTDDPQHRLRALASIGLFLLGPIVLLSGLSRLTTGGLGWLAVVEIASVGALALSIWHRHLRETKIPLDAVRQVTIGTDDRALELAHTPRVGPLSILRDDPRRRRHRFRTPADGRRARELCRLRGLDVVDDQAAEPEYTYRFETREGVCFCERCGGQISPGDRACSACEYRLRVPAAEVA